MSFSNNSVFNIFNNIHASFSNYFIVCARACQRPQRVL